MTGTASGVEMSDKTVTLNLTFRRIDSGIAIFHREILVFHISWDLLDELKAFEHECAMSDIPDLIAEFGGE